MKIRYPDIVPRTLNHGLQMEISTAPNTPLKLSASGRALQRTNVVASTFDLFPVRLPVEDGHGPLDFAGKTLWLVPNPSADERWRRCRDWDGER